MMMIQQQEQQQDQQQDQQRSRNIFLFLLLVLSSWCSWSSTTSPAGRHSGSAAVVAFVVVAPAPLLHPQGERKHHHHHDHRLPLQEQQQQQYSTSISSIQYYRRGGQQNSLSSSPPRKRYHNIIKLRLLLGSSNHDDHPDGEKQPQEEEQQQQHGTTTTMFKQASSSLSSQFSSSSRRDWFKRLTTVAVTSSIGVGSGFFGDSSMSPRSTSNVAYALGPVKVPLTPINYTAKPCPPNKPIPGQMAMKGMKGLCVTVQATLDEQSPKKELNKVGVYGFVTDAINGDSVLANNPDLSTDAGQFAIVEHVTNQDKEIIFEFVAAVSQDRDLSSYENGIGPLEFNSLKLISFPGGQQYGEINPCEMNEFSSECEEWENTNGPYERGSFMVKSNPRTKGR